MDPVRFDDIVRSWTRRLAHRPTRRSLLRTFAGAGAGSLLAASRHEEAAAARCRPPGPATGLPGQPGSSGGKCGLLKLSGGREYRVKCCRGAVCLDTNGGRIKNKEQGRCYCLDGYRREGKICRLLIPMRCREGGEVCQDPSQCCEGRACEEVNPLKKACDSDAVVCQRCGPVLVQAPNPPVCCGLTGKACGSSCDCCGDLKCTDGACCTAVKGVCGEGTRCCAPAAGCGLVRPNKPDGAFCRRDAELPDAPVCCVDENQPCTGTCDCCSDLVCQAGRCRTHRTPPPCTDSSCF